MPLENVDPTTLTEKEIRDAFKYDGVQWGSDPEWIAGQIAKALADRVGIRAYRDNSGRLRAYWQAPEYRK